jgi:tripartite-type tricarboxylate transporter receptor subunit TctC
MPVKFASVLTLGAISVLFCAVAANADPIEDFYKGKTVTIVTSTGVGGPFDLTARALARHMPRFLPGRPTMIVRNMPGGGNVLATNFMYTQAAKDGTFIATVNNIIPLHQILDGRGVRYDARNFNWLGSTGGSNLMTWAWHTSGFKTIEDVMQRELIAGATGTGSGTVVYQAAMNMVLGTKFKIVMGYPTSPAVDLAMERGEVQARGGASLAGMLQEHGDWIREKKIVALVQVGSVREKDYPDLPLMHELAKTPEQRQVLSLVSSPPSLGRPFLTTPDVPPERVAALRYAFAETMKDEAFLAEAKQLGLDMNPMTSEAVAQLVNDTINAPADAIAQAKVAIEPAGGSGGSKPGE